MASEIKLVAQPRSGTGTAKTFDYKPGGKHPADANNFYKIVVDGKEELPAGTKIARKGNSVVFDFPDGTNFEIENWCSVSDSRLTDLVNGQAYSAGDGTYINAKDIDSGACVIWGADAGQAGAVLGDSGAAPVAGTSVPPPADDHGAGGVITAILGLGLVAAAVGLSGGSGGGGSNPPPDTSKPTAGTPDALNEDFAPIAINASTIKATDDSGANQIKVTAATIKSATGFDLADVTIVPDVNGVPTLQLNPSGENKFGTIVTEVQLVDAAGNTNTQEVTFTVNAVNDAPQNVVPESLSPISSSVPDYVGLRGKLSVNDVDEATGPDNFKIGTVKLDVNEGTLIVTDNPNVTNVTNNTNSLLLTGSQNDINAVLATIIWNNTPFSDVSRNVTLTMTSTDVDGLTDVDVVILPLSTTGASVGGGVVLSAADMFTGDGLANSANTVPTQSVAVSSLIGNVQDQIPPST